MTTATPHIDREMSPAGIRSTCGLCGAYNVACYGAFSLLDEAETWETRHTEDCTPDTVLRRAAALREAADTAHHISRTGPPELWDTPPARQAAAAITAGLRVRALDLETRTATATNTRKDTAT